MPGFDGTGPNGLGPMTGRGMGNCAQGRGYGRGRGFGGFGRGFYRFSNSIEYATPQEKIEMLKATKKRLETEIEVLESEAKNE